MRVKENKYPKVLIGSSVHCLECGERTIEYTELMRCFQCNVKYTEEDNDDYGTCTCCGSHWAWDDFVYVRDEIEVCPVCAEREIYMCPRCDTLIFNEDKVFDTYTEEYYCNECMSEMTLERK